MRKVIIKDKNGNQINPPTKENQIEMITRMAKDALRVEDRTTDTDEFIASGVEAAFKSYTISAGNRTLVKGELNVFDSLNVIGTLKVIGTVNVGI